MSPRGKGSWLTRFFAPQAEQPSDPADILALGVWPKAAYAVGDVHGCFDLYRALETRIAADAATLDGPALLVVLGDFIDRGPQSAAMIDHLLAPPPKHVMRVVLRGNHEEMFTRFLQDPTPEAGWLRYGGLETLASYGVNTAALETGDLSARQIKMLLASTIPPEHRAFLESLPDALILPPFMFTHAGVDRKCAPEEQRPEALRWGRADADGLEGFPLRVVHGHTPCADGNAYVDAQRINLDTGAFVSGKLSAARLSEDGQVAVFEEFRDRP